MFAQPCKSISGAGFVKKQPTSLRDTMDQASVCPQQQKDSLEGWHYGLLAFFSGFSSTFWWLSRKLGRVSQMKKFKNSQETA